MPTCQSLSPQSFADDAPVQRVFCSDALLHRIAAACSPRNRLILGTLDKACRRAADSPDLWRVISWRIVGGDQPARVWTYAEAAEMGNRLSLVLRQFGRHCYKAGRLHRQRAAGFAGGWCHRGGHRVGGAGLTHLVLHVHLGRSTKHMC